MVPISVSSEIERLTKVIIHRPDEGISRISPRRAEDLLFDDIVYLPEMQREHDIFKQVLECFLDKKNVLETFDLIKEGMDYNPELRKELIEKAIEYEELPQSYYKRFEKMDNDTLTEVLISGYCEKDDYIFFDPIPNFVFTRDIAVTIKEHIIVTKASKVARQRENLLTRFIFLAHPDFVYLKDEQKIINLNDLELFPPSKKGERVSIEGGDIMMFDNDYVIIGRSERTTNHAFHSIKDILFKKGIINNVVKVNIPSDRTMMHIDTLFTRIDHDVVACYKPIIYNGMSSNVELYRSNGEKKIFSSVKNFLLEEINPDMKFVFAGGGESPYQEREQWTDGVNLVAIKPGVAISYDRNHRTDKSFRKYGFQIIKAEDLIAISKTNPNFANTLSKTIITLPSGELSRARGGSHCMTCPLNRN